MGNLFKNIKRLIVLIIGLLLLGIIGVVCYVVYVDSNSFNAKNYLIERYALETKKLKPKKYIQYVYEDITNCEQEWIRKCTDNDDLLYQYVFEYGDTIIIVSENKKGELSDDSSMLPVNKDNDKEE